MLKIQNNMFTIACPTFHNMINHVVHFGKVVVLRQSAYVYNIFASDTRP